MKVTTLKVVIKGKSWKTGITRQVDRLLIEYYTNIVDVCIAGPTKKKSPPRLIDEHEIPPTELIKQGAELLNMSLEEYLKHVADEAAKAAAKAQGFNVEKEAEKSAKNVEAEGVKETLVEGVVQSDSSATESDEFDPTKIAPTSYVSGKQKYKGSPKKKKDLDEEDSTSIPTPDEKKKLQ
ncbi:hypothetical protein Hanom_Chr12g01141621 [Helianthus anomalus]